MSVPAIVQVDADDEFSAYSMYHRQHNIFTDASIINCTEKVLTLRLMQDSSYDVYLDDTFYITFVNATLRGVTPAPERAPFVVRAAALPNDVAAAVYAAQASSQASLLSGPAASSNQALAIMGLNGCARPAMQTATKSAVQSMVPFPVSNGFQGWLFGNLLLLLFVPVVHFPVVVIVREVASVSWYTARELALFPSLSFTVVQMLHAGIAYSSINLVVWGNSGADIAVGWVGMVYCWAMPVAMWVWSQKFLETVFMYFSFFAALHPVAKFFTPVGFFTPSQFSGALGNLRELTKSHMIVPFIEINGFCLIGSIRVSTPSSCATLYSCLGVWHLLFAIYYAVLRPNRSGFFNLLAAVMDIELALIGFGNAYWAYNRDFGLNVVSKLLLVQNITGSLVSVVSLGLSVLETFLWRPREIREKASQAVLGVLSQPILQTGEHKFGVDADDADNAAFDIEPGYMLHSIAPDIDSFIEAATGAPPLPQSLDPAQIPCRRAADATNGAVDPFAMFDDAGGDGDADLQNGRRGVAGVTERRTVDDDVHVEASVSYGRRIVLPTEEEDRRILDLLESMAPQAPSEHQRVFTREEKFLLSMPDPTGQIHPWHVDPAEVAAATRAQIELQRRESEEQRRLELFGPANDARSWLGFNTELDDVANEPTWASDAMSLLGIVTPLQEGAAAAAVKSSDASHLGEQEREELQRLATWEPKSVREALEKFDAVERLRNPWGSASPPGHVATKGGTSQHDDNASSDRAPSLTVGGAVGVDQSWDAALATAPPSSAVEANASLHSFLHAAALMDPLSITPEAASNMTDEELLGPALSHPRTARQRVEAALRRVQMKENIAAARRVARGEAAIAAILEKSASTAVRVDSSLSPPRRQRGGAAPQPGNELWDIL